MTFTDTVIILFILALLAYAVYDQFIMPRRNGPVLLAIPLLRRSRVDGLIFVGLIAILIYNNITQHGTPITTAIVCAGADGTLFILDPYAENHFQTARLFLRQRVDRISAN